MLAPRRTLHSTPLRVFRRALRLVDARPDDLLVDVGCGDGRLVVDAARTIGMRAVGVEIDAERAQQAREAAREAGVEQLVAVETANALEFEIPGDATIVFLFLIDRGLRLVEEQLSTTVALRLTGCSLVKRQLERAANDKLRVITYLYRIPGVVPDEKHYVEAKDGAAFPIFIYRFPLKLELPRQPEASKKQEGEESAEETTEDSEPASSSEEGEVAELDNHLDNGNE